MLIRVPVRSRSSPKITLTCKTERKCHCVNWTQATKMKPRSLEKIATEKMLYSVRHVCLIPRGVLADSRATGFWFRARYHGKEDTLPSVLCVHAKCSHGPSPDTPWYLVQSRFLFSTLDTPRNEADATRSPLKGNEPMAQAQNTIKGLGVTPCEQSILLSFAWLRRRKEALPESPQTFEVAAAPTSGLVNLVLSCQTCFSSASICFLKNCWS